MMKWSIGALKLNKGGKNLSPPSDLELSYGSMFLVLALGFGVKLL